MADLQPAFRVSFYNRSGGIMTPAAGSWHSDPFQITTDDALGAPWKAYLNSIEGANGKIDPLTKNVEGSGLSITVLDPALADDNTKRWVTSFVGNIERRAQFVGKVALVEQRVNGVWSIFGVYRVKTVSMDRRVTYTFDLEDFAEDLEKTKIFVGRPHPDARNVVDVTYSPLGLSGDYGGSGVPAPMVGVTSIQKGRYQVDALRSVRRRHDNIFVEDSTDVRPYKSEIDYSALANIDLRVRFIDPSGTAAWHNREAKIRHIKLGRGRAPLFVEVNGVVAQLPVLGIGVGTDALFWDWIRTENLPTSDPAYVDTFSMPVGANIQYQVVRRESVSSSNVLGKFGLLIADDSPVTILEDVLGGYFGYIGTDGQPLQKFAYDMGDVDWDSIPSTRFRVKEGNQELGEWIRKNICTPFHITYRWEPVVIDDMPTCRMKFIDLRYDTMAPTLGSLPTLTDSELSVNSTPSWKHEYEGSSGSIAVKSKIENIENLAVAAILGGADGTGARKDIFRLPSNLFTEQPFDFISIDATASDQRKEGVFEIDASMVPESIGTRVYGVSNPADDYSASVSKLEGKLAKLASNYTSLVYPGMMTVQADFVRSFSSVNSIRPGSWCNVDLSSSASVLTNQRGGVRLMLCIQRQDFGPNCRLTFVDQGSGVATTGTVALTDLVNETNQDAGTFLVSGLTGNQLAEIQIAVMPATFAAPAEDSPLWTGLNSTPGGPLYSNGPVRVVWNLQGRTVYLRARVVSPDGGVRSTWRSPVAFLTGNAIPNLSGLTATDQTRSTVQLSWTNASVTEGVAILIANPVGGTPVEIMRLPTGIESFTLTGLEQYTGTIRVFVKNVSINGGLSTGASVDISPSTDEPTEESPDILQVSISRGRAPGDPAETGGGKTELVYALEFRISPGELQLPIEVERNDGTTTEIIATIESSEVTNPAYYLEFDGIEDQTYTYRFRHNAPNRAPGNWTSAIEIVPVLVDLQDLSNPGNKGHKVMWIPDDLAFAKPETKVIGPLTSISFRNNADSQDNLLIEDNGDTTIRGNAEVKGPDGVNADKYRVMDIQVVGEQQPGPTDAAVATGTTAPATGGASGAAGTGSTVFGAAGAVYTSTEAALINSLIGANNTNADIITALTAAVTAQAGIINNLATSANTNRDTLDSLFTQYNDSVNKLNALLAALRTHGLIT